MVRAMAAALTCPYCSHSIVPDPEAPAERCPSCAGDLLIAYRYQLIRARGKIAGGVLYEAIDSGFAQPTAVLFVEDPNDREASERFVAGHRLFANLRTRGLVTIHEVSRANHRRPHVVMDWFAGSTLDRHVGKVGPLDPTLVWAMTSNLLIGFERAHRALPALVHGQVHPGKIGFRKPADEGGAAVLYGFEWARQVSEQDSSLADSFSADADVVHERASSLDLRALARTIIYAATGRWIEDAPMDRQRQQAATMMAGPMAPFFDRMLAAGTPDGYKSTSVARDEFELILAGGGRRRPPQAGERRAAPSPISAGEFAEMVHSVGEEEDDDDDGHDQHDEHEHGYSSTPATGHGPSAALLEQVRQRQAQLAARTATTTKEPAKGKVAWAIVAVAIGGVMFASIVEDIEDNSNPIPPPPTVQQIQAVPPIPDWTVEPTPEVAPVPIVQPPTFAARKWSAKVESTAKGKANPIKAASKCELWVRPNFDSSFNCRWAIDCKERDGWTRYYGNEGSGFGNCGIEGDKVVSLSDLEDNDGDGLLVFDATGEKPWALIGDRFANPPRVVLVRLEGEGELAEQPSHDEPRLLERRLLEQVDQQEFAAAGRLLEQLGAREGLVLDLVPDEPAPSDDGLPATLDIFALQSTIDSIQSQLLACSAPAGTKVDVDLTISGNTGIASDINLTNPANDDHDLCLRAVLSVTQFDRFSDENLNVSWVISW
jgi:hypothetical protein